MGLELNGSHDHALGVSRAFEDRGGGQWVACAKRTGQKLHPSLMTVADVPRMARDRLGQPSS